MLRWWQDHEGEFPNVAVMARQYLGCPATSAAVERLFSKVGIAFSKKAKSSQASILAAKMYVCSKSVNVIAIMFLSISYYNYTRVPRRASRDARARLCNCKN